MAHHAAEASRIHLHSDFAVDRQSEELPNAAEDPAEVLHPRDSGDSGGFHGELVNQQK